MDGHGQAKRRSGRGLRRAVTPAFGVAAFTAHPERLWDETPDDFSAGGGGILRDTGGKGSFGIQAGGNIELHAADAANVEPNEQPICYL